MSALCYLSSSAVFLLPRNHTNTLVCRKNLTFPINSVALKKRCSFPIVIKALAENDGKNLDNMVENIKEKGAEIYHNIKESVQGNAEKVSQKVEEAKETTKDQLDSHKPTDQVVREDVVDHVEKAGHSAGEGFSAAKRAVGEKLEEWKEKSQQD